MGAPGTLVPSRGSERPRRLLKTVTDPQYRRPPIFPGLADASSDHRHRRARGAVTVEPPRPSPSRESGGSDRAGRDLTAEEGEARDLNRGLRVVAPDPETDEETEAAGAIEPSPGNARLPPAHRSAPGDHARARTPHAGSRHLDAQRLRARRPHSSAEGAPPSRSAPGPRAAEQEVSAAHHPSRL